ncbi:unnamed protein product, partial [Pylaiella littoralis]
MEPAASEGDTERHAELVALLVAAMRRRRERRVARTVAVWQVVLRDYSDDDDAGTDEDNDPPMKRTRRVLPDQTTVLRFGGECLARRVLASLHILGRGNFFEDMTQMSHISEPTIQITFHMFNKLFAQEFYHDHVHLPTAGEDQDQVMRHYDLLGFTGAIGSTDVTHIKWAACPYSWAKHYTGKEGFATIAFQAIVDHTGRLLAATKGFGGSMNDKTIITYDAAITKIREDPVYKEKEYTLFDKHGEPFQRKGNYGIVDNGYNKVRLLCGSVSRGFAGTDIEIRWSKALESVRKDVECFFGILKGRFRILKLGILFQSLEDINNMFFTCCTLHNMLHAFDGLDE